MKIGDIPARIFALIMFNDAIDTAAQLLMKKGIGQWDSVYPWLGISLYISNFFIWMRVLSRINLSIEMPVASVGYLLIPIAPVVFLHEKVGMLRWFGILFIVIGVYVVSKSKAQGAK